MTDVHSPETRSRNMSAIRSADTKPEVWLRKVLFAQGFRFRKNFKKLPGKPDIVLPKYQAVIQVNGCFWHGHNCHLFKVPKTRTEFWLGKISGNRERDQKNIKALELSGWRVLVVWECVIKGRSRLSETEITEQVTRWITSFSASSEITSSDRAELSQESGHVVRDAD